MTFSYGSYFLSEQIVSTSTTVDDDTPSSIEDEKKPKEVLTPQEVTLTVETTPEIPSLLMTCEAHPDGNCPFVVYNYVLPIRLDV